MQGLRKGSTVNSIKLETGLRSNRAGVPYILLLRIEAMRFPTFRLLLYSRSPGYPNSENYPYTGPDAQNSVWGMLCYISIQ